MNDRSAPQEAGTCWRSAYSAASQREALLVPGILAAGLAVWIALKVINVATGETDALRSAWIGFLLMVIPLSFFGVSWLVYERSRRIAFAVRNDVFVERAASGRETEVPIGAITSVEIRPGAPARVEVVVAQGVRESRRGLSVVSNDDNTGVLEILGDLQETRAAAVFDSPTNEMLALRAEAVRWQVSHDSADAPRGPSSAYVALAEARFWRARDRFGLARKRGQQVDPVLVERVEALCDALDGRRG